MKPLYAIAAACLALSAPAAVTANAGRFNGTWTISVTNDNGTGHVQSLTFQQTSPTTALVTTSGINTIAATINGKVYR